MNNYISEELQSEYEKDRRIANITKGLCIVGVATFILGGVMGQFGIVILGFIMFGAGVVVMANRSGIKKDIMEKVLPGILERELDNVSYNSDGHIAEAIINNTEMGISSYDNLYGSDHIIASYKGINIEMSDIRLEHEYTDSDGDRQKRTVFQGTWIICDFEKRISTDLLIYPKSGVGILDKVFNKNYVETENMEFNKIFDIKANDGHDAFYILTPHMMEYIMNMQNMSGGDVHMRFQSNGKVHIAINSDKDLFEFDNEKELSQACERFHEELKYILGLIDELRLVSNKEEAYV